MSICCWLIYFSIQIGISDIKHYPVKHSIVGIYSEDKLPIETLNKLELKIKDAISRRPDNAEYHEYLGRIYYLRALSNYSSVDLSKKDIVLAYTAHKKATKLRPKWPYSWANMALMRAHLQKFDAVFIYSIDQAVKLGAWEIASNESLLQSVFLGWKVVSVKIKQQGIDALERIYLQDEDLAMKLLTHYQGQIDICSRLKHDALRKVEVCNI